MTGRQEGLSVSDRLHETQRHRPVGAAAAPLRPQVSQQLPLAYLQAAAGNRAVASAIQRATGTAQLPKAQAQEQATSSAADGLEITPVTESRRPSGETPRGAHAETEQQAAVDEVTKQKEKVAAASLARADAAADVWTSSGEAVEAWENAAKFRGDAKRLTREAGEAESSRTGLLEEERGLRETAGTATARQQTAGGRAETHKEAEGQARKAAGEALAEERKFTQQAKKAEGKRAAAEARVAEFTRLSKEAREKQEAAEARVSALRKLAKEAEEKQKAAEAAALGKAAAEDDALQQAAKAQAEAEAEDKVAKSVKEWAGAAANALRQAGEAELEARRRAGDAEGADAARTTAEGDQQEWAETVKSAQEQATAARNQAAVWDKEAETAAEEHTKARNEAAEHGKDAAAAQQQADTVRDQAAVFAETARQKREAADSARGKEQQQADIAAGAQRYAAAAAQTQLEQAAAEAAAMTALTARRRAKKAANEAAEAARKKAAGAGEQTVEAGPADAGRVDEAGGLLRKGPERAVKAVGHAVEKTAAKVKPWVDPPDTGTLRGSAPIGGALRADASRTGDTGRMDGTVVQQHVENPINTISDVTGAVNDVVALKDAAGKRGESGPASHAHRKNWRGKPLGILTNVLMSVNDGVKIAGNSLSAVKNMAPLAALGDAGGALTIVFSSVVAARDAMVIKDTRARREALKKHFHGTAAQRVGNLQDVLNTLGTATAELVRESATLTASSAGPDAEDSLKVRVRIDGLRRELLGHMAGLREYAVDKKKRKLAHRAANLGGNGARIAAGAVAIAAASGAVSGPVGPAVAGGLTAAALGGYAVKKGVKKANKRYTSVRQPEKYARTTLAQEDTKEPKEPTAPRMSKDGKGGRKRDAWKEAVTVTHSIKQGKRQLRAQEIYALAAGPAVPAGKNVPKDIREDMRAFLKALKCGPDDHKQSYKDWEASLNDPEQQTEWEEAIAKQLASA